MPLLDHISLPETISTQMMQGNKRTAIISHHHPGAELGAANSEHQRTLLLKTSMDVEAPEFPGEANPFGLANWPHGVQRTATSMYKPHRTT